LLAKRLKQKLTPRFIFKTKQWVSILIVGFGVFLLLQGVFPKGLEAGLEKIPTAAAPLEKPIPRLMTDNKKIRKTKSVPDYVRHRADSDRGTSFGRCMPSHSTTMPFQDY